MLIRKYRQLIVLMGIAIGMGHVSRAETVPWTAAEVISIEQVTNQRAPNYNCSSEASGSVNGTSTQTSSTTSVQRGSVQTQANTTCQAVDRNTAYWHTTIRTTNETLVLRPYQKLTGVAGGIIDFLRTGRGEGRKYLLPRMSIGSTIAVAIFANGSVDLRTADGTVYASEVVSRVAVSRQERTQTMSTPVAPSQSIPTDQRPQIFSVELGASTELESAVAHPVNAPSDRDLSYVVLGERSNAASSTTRPQFLIQQPESSPFARSLELYRMEVVDGVRRVVSQRGGKQVATPIPITITQVTPTMYQLAVLQDLTPGEYALSPQTSNDVFLFRVR